MLGDIDVESRAAPVPVGVLLFDADVEVLFVVRAGLQPSRGDLAFLLDRQSLAHFAQAAGMCRERVLTVGGDVIHGGMCREEFPTGTLWQKISGRLSFWIPLGIQTAEARVALLVPSDVAAMPSYTGFSEFLVDQS